MVSLESLCETVQPEIPLPRRGFGRRLQEGMILVVDDTSASGRQIDHLRKLICTPVKYAAIYVEDRPTICVDYYHSKVPDFAQFYEWTMFHDVNNRLLLTDLDGVLCDDWQGGNEDEHPDAYRDFLMNVPPRRIPSIPLKGIVTNRLERHRTETEGWLRRHGIEFDKLIMSPHPTFAARDQARDSAARKAAAYQADSSLRLFIESDDQQAQEIARRTGRPVFSVVRNGLV
jgi:orotate phosphoribosyltransferase